MTEKDKQIAVFIDAENTTAKYLDYIISELKQRGNLAIKRVYGTPEETNTTELKNKCLDFSIEPVVQYNKVPGKNSSDINLVISVMDVLYQKGIDIFVIVSSDSDFTGLVSRIRQDSKIVIGIGEQKTPAPFRNACNEFLFIENLLPSASNTKSKKINEDNIAKLDQIKIFIKNLINNQEDGQLLLSQLQEALKKEYPDFSQKSYGYKIFSDFIDKMSEFDVLTKSDGCTRYAIIHKEKKNK